MRTPRQIFEINFILICALIRHFSQQVAFGASFLGPSVWHRMWCERVTEIFALANERLCSKFRADHLVTQFNWFVNETPRHSHSARSTIDHLSAQTLFDWRIENVWPLLFMVPHSISKRHKPIIITKQPIEIFSRSNFVYNPIAYEIVVEFFFFLGEKCIQSRADSLNAGKK